MPFFKELIDNYIESHAASAVSNSAILPLLKVLVILALVLVVGKFFTRNRILLLLAAAIAYVFLFL